MTEDKLIEEIKPFLDACDKMVASKFIMIDKRISDILKSIATVKPVFSVVKECMINFSFEREWKLATAKVGQLLPPEDSRKFIAFVFSLLSNIDSRRLSASDVLSRHYQMLDTNQGPYNQFCENIIVRFKETVTARLLNKDTGERPKNRTEKQISISKEVLSRLAFLAKDLREYIQGLKKLKGSAVTKGELAEVVGGLIEAINNGHTRYIKPFVMAIKAGHGKDKEIERRLIEIKDIVNRTMIDE